MAQHMVEQHLSFDAVAAMAKGAKVKEVVLVHNALNQAQAERAVSEIEKAYGGKVVYAHDLEKF